MGLIGNLADTADGLGKVGENARKAASGLSEAADAANGAASAFGSLGRAVNDGGNWKAANEQIAGLGKAVDAVSKSIYDDLIPGVREMFDTISEKTRDNPLALYWNEVLNKFQEGTISANEMYQQLDQILAGMGRISAQGATFLGPAIEQLRQYKGELNDIVKKIEDGKRRGKEAVEETKKASETVGKVGKGGKSAGGKFTSVSSHAADMEDLQRLLVARNQRS